MISLPMKQPQDIVSSTNYLIFCHTIHSLLYTGCFFPSIKTILIVTLNTQLNYI